MGIKSNSLTVVIAFVLFAAVATVNAGDRRVVRSPQFGGSFSSASAQAGSFGGLRNQRHFGPGFGGIGQGSGFGQGGGFGHGGGFGPGGGFGNRPVAKLPSISISKSISIGSGGSAQSSASGK